MIIGIITVFGLVSIGLIFLFKSKRANQPAEQNRSVPSAPPASSATPAGSGTPQTTTGGMKDSKRVGIAFGLMVVAISILCLGYFPGQSGPFFKKEWLALVALILPIVGMGVLWSTPGKMPVAKKLLTLLTLATTIAAVATILWHQGMIAKAIEHWPKSSHTSAWGSSGFSTHQKMSGPSVGNERIIHLEPYETSGYISVPPGRRVRTVYPKEGRALLQTADGQSYQDGHNSKYLLERPFDGFTLESQVDWPMDIRVMFIK